LKLARLVAPLSSAGTYFSLLLTLLLVAAAYQVRPTYDVPIGTATDQPLLSGFSTPERPPVQGDLPYSTYRWSQGNATITFADVGRQDFDVWVSVNGARPPGQAEPTLRIDVDGRTLLDPKPPPGPMEYQIRVPRDAVENGTLALRLTVNPFHAPGDTRELGIIVTHVRAAPAATPDRFVEPPLAPVVVILGTVGLLGVLLAAMGWGGGAVALGSSLLGVLGAALTAFDRLWLTSRQWYLVWPQTVVAGGIFVLLIAIVGRWELNLGGARFTARQWRALLTLCLAVFAIRLAGQLHPQIFVFDLGFHINLLHLVEGGRLLFTTQPAEMGGFGYATFYPPTPYLFIIPLSWLVQDERLAVRLLTVGLGTLGAVPVFYIAARVARDARAGLLAAALYLTVPMAVLPYSWGITANVFGEFFALCALAVAVGAGPNLRPNRPTFWVLAGLLLLALLSHAGVVGLTAVAFALISLLWAIARRHAKARTGQAATLFGALVVAGLAAFVLYYRNFVGEMLNTLTKAFTERSAGTAPQLTVGGSVEDVSLGLTVRNVDSWQHWLQWGLQGFWNEARAYYQAWPIPGAALGYISLTRRSDTGPVTPRRRLTLAAAGWALAVLLFALVGWATNFYVRYALFALPVVALGSGVLLSRITAKHNAGRWVALLVVVYFAVAALGLWHYRITYAFK
jgi:hypothetical protein